MVAFPLTKTKRMPRVRTAGGQQKIAPPNYVGDRAIKGREAASPHRVLTAVDLFAGAGGFSLGLRRAGFEVVLANEYSTDAEWTYRHNTVGDGSGGVLPGRPIDPSRSARRAYRAEAREQIIADRESLSQDFDRHMRGGDIREALPDRWLRTWLERRPGGVDLLVAGPPCQGFSCAGKSLPRRRAKPARPRSDPSHQCRPAAHCHHRECPRYVGAARRSGSRDRLRTLSRRQESTPGTTCTQNSFTGNPSESHRPADACWSLESVETSLTRGASERLQRLLFPVACPRSRPTDGRRPGNGGSGGVFSDRQGDPWRPGKCTAGLWDRSKLD